MMAHESRHHHHHHHHHAFTEFSSTANNHMMQSFEPNHDLFGIHPGMEMLGNPNSSPNPNSWSVLNNQGLALSLTNPNMAAATTSHQQQQQQQQQILVEDGRFLIQSQFPYQLKRSRYMIPAQELLTEFCNLGGSSSSSKKKAMKGSQWDQEGGNMSSSLYSLNLVELQKRKAKLLSMLEEVYRRYRRYCDQMRGVVSSFEAVAGEGAAMVYSTLASKAMSKHFRCLRDGVMGQIEATKKAMGEKDAVAPGTTKGETPRLKMLEQCLRQQKAFQQAGMMENHPWRPQRGLPERSVSVLRAWLFEHFLHPYPSDVDKHILARQTGLSRSQVSNWFINARVRLWKPMVEEMYVEELKEEDNPNPINPDQLQNPSSSLLQPVDQDQKPAPVQLLNNDSDSLSSIINSKNSHNYQQGGQFGTHAVDLDFAGYNNSTAHVSLTLGLQQHDGGGMSLSFLPASHDHHHSLLFSREEMGDGRPVQFSILDGDHHEDQQNQLPYRNLMGAQALLHDLAG